MQIKLLKDLLWSPDGCTVTTIPAGDYAKDEIPDRAQVIAGQLGIVGVVVDGDSNQTISAEPEPIKKGKK